jgi:hypothetical protein
VRFDTTAEELERLLLQKEGESANTGMQARTPGPGLGGKRVLGKAMKGGGLLLKGKNPANVRVSMLGLHWVMLTGPEVCRLHGRRTTSGRACRPHQIVIGSS